MMIEYPIDLLIKQTLRSVVFDSTNMGIMSSRAQHFQTKSNSNLTKTLAKDSAFCSLLKSPETIKWLFERPNDYMYKIFENEAFKETLGTIKDESELKVIKHKILFGFLKELRDLRPPQAMEWVMFQHFMYYVYRNFLTPKPTVTDENLPNVIVKKMFKLVVSLTFEDKAQFYVRIITLLREYVMTARDNYEELTVTADVTIYLKCLLSYYSAFCSAANKLSTVLADFDQFMNMRYHINWYCLNQRMFFQYFFMRPSVQCKISVFNKLVEEDKSCNRALIESYNSFIEEMSTLDRHWELQRRRISFLSDRNPKDESQWLQKDWKLFEEITRIMKTNFWIIRNNEWKNTEQANELDGHFLAIVEDTWHVADRLIAPEGNCICEDCMAAEFLQGLVTGSIQQPLGSAKLVMCYICRDVMTVNLLGNHIVNKHDDSHSPRADVTKNYKWQPNSPGVKKGLPMKRPSTKLCKVLSETMELAKNKDAQIFHMNDDTFELKIDREAIKAKIAKRFLECSEALFSSSDNEKFVLTPELILSSECSSPSDTLKVGNQAKADKEPIANVASEPPTFASDNFSDEMEGCRAAFEEFVKSRTEGTDLTGKDHRESDDSKKTVSEKKSKENLIDVLVPIDSCVLTTPTPASTNNKSTDTGCAASHTCGHKCKKEEETAISNGGTKKSCHEPCDHHKEPKKCDCAYCEVFGSNVAALSHKVNETRDRLRTRLNQRKEKISNTPKPPLPPMITPESCCKPQPKVSVSDVNYYRKAAANRSACSHSKTSSCENCMPINIKVLSNISDSKHATQILCVDQPKIDERPDLSDIDGLIDFIQGNKPIDKAAIARKKAAKKARQRIKKEQARLRKEEEEEARKTEEKRIREEKLREELRTQASAKHQAAEQLKKKKQNKLESELQQKQEVLSKKQTQAQRKVSGKQPKQESDLMEETIPAMVTIKRIVENNNSPPTVTITLKGSTPDQDKLLYTLVNGHTSDYVATGNTESKEDKAVKKKNKKAEKKARLNGEANDKEKRKKKILTPDPKGVVTTKEFKVTLSVDKSFHKGKEAAENVKKVSTKQKDAQTNTKNGNKNKSNKGNELKKVDVKEIKLSQTKQVSKDIDIDIPSLKLPPGITITKVSGPLMNKNCKPAVSTSTSTAAQYQNVPVSKSGVIVVDTEKLIQQSITANANKKNKKKKNKCRTSSVQSGENAANSKTNAETKPAMVTLKNPIFHTLQTKLVEKSDIPVIPYNEQASITKGENGMVTIRRPRCLQLPIEKESSMTDFLSELKPVMGPNVTASFGASRSSKEHKQKFSGTNGLVNNISSNNYVPNGDYKNTSGTYLHNSSSESNKNGLSAHEILWGLPGIEITKVTKGATSGDTDLKKSCQTADVSIIPTGAGVNNGEKFNFDRDDWPFESVFAPKDILEDDLDADERELEAFKRFCQQSVPPKHKEKVAHLNVKDIVLKKKNDVTYS